MHATKRWYKFTYRCVNKTFSSTHCMEEKLSSSQTGIEWISNETFRLQMEDKENNLIEENVHLYFQNMMISNTEYKWNVSYTEYKWDGSCPTSNRKTD